MKKIAQILFVLSVSLVVAGCVYPATNKNNPYKGTVYNIEVPAKQVEILGLVYVDSERGEGITYRALLEAAEKKGGNGIANVMIDVEHINERGRNYVVYHGSALAIKYTNENIAKDAAKLNSISSLETISNSNNNSSNNSKPGESESGSGTIVLGVLAGFAALVTTIIVLTN